MKSQPICSLIASLSFISSIPSVTLAELPINPFQQSNHLAQNSSQAIQNLPDGKYLYGKGVEFNFPNKNQRVLFIKEGNQVVGLKYNSGAEECFRGTLTGDTITNIFFPNFSREGNLTFVPNSRISFLGNGSYRLDLNEVSSEIEVQFEECLQIFSRER